MKTDSFEVFNRISLYLLVKLFEEFPRYVEIDPNHIGIEAKPKSENGTEEEIWENSDIGEATVTWLRDEGFISIGNQTFDGWEARLSLKGLTVLGYEGPAGPEPSKYENFAENAKDVLRAGSTAAVSEVAKSVLTQGLRYAPWIFT